MATDKKRRKSASKRKRSASGGQIPLTVLKKRLAKLSRTVKERESRRQTSMFS